MLNSSPRAYAHGLLRHLVGRGIVICLCVGLLAGCASRFVGYQIEGVKCGYEQLDPDAESIQAVTTSLGQIAGQALRSAAGAPPAGFTAPRTATPPLPTECTQAETCVHYEVGQDGLQSCTVIRGGQAP